MAADTMSIRKGGIILIGIAETALHFLLFADDRDHAGRRHEAARRAPVSGLREQGHFPPSGGSGGLGDVLFFRSPLRELTIVPHFCVCASFGLDLRGQYLPTPNCTTKWSSFGGCLKRRQMWCNDASGFLPVMGDSRGVMILTLWVLQFHTSL